MSVINNTVDRIVVVESTVGDRLVITSFRKLMRIHPVLKRISVSIQVDLMMLIFSSCIIIQFFFCELQHDTTCNYIQ